MGPNRIRRLADTDDVLYSEAEKNASEHVIGFSVNRPDALFEIGLVPSDFADPLLGRAWEAILELSSSKDPIDALTVSARVGCVPEEIRKLQEKKYVGSVPGWVQLIKRGSTARATHSVCSAIYSRLTENQDSEAVLEELITTLNGVRQTSDKAKEALDVAKARVEYLIDLHERKERGEKVRLGVPTGLNALDNFIGGVNRGIVTVLGARPAMGKSSVALQFATGALQNGEGVHHFPLEDRNENTLDRKLSESTGLTAQEIRSLRFDNEARERLRRAASTIPKGWKVDDSSGLTIREICRRVRSSAKRNNTGLCILDYLQLLKPLPGENEMTKLVTAMNELKDLAKDLNIAVLAVAQLNRGLEERGRLQFDRDGSYEGYKPVMDDFKWSGSIEEVAKTVIGIWRPGFYNRDIPDDTIIFEIIKNNFGEGNRPFPFEWVGKNTKILNKLKKAKDDK